METTGGSITEEAKDLALAAEDAALSAKVGPTLYLNEPAHPVRPGRPSWRARPEDELSPQHREPHLSRRIMSVHGTDPTHPSHQVMPMDEEVAAPEPNGEAPAEVPIAELEVCTSIEPLFSILGPSFLMPFVGSVSTTCSSPNLA